MNNEEQLKDLKRAIIEAAGACERAKRGSGSMQEAFEHLGYLLRALPSWLTPATIISEAWFSGSSERLHQELSDERVRSANEILTLKREYTMADKVARDLMSESADARAVLAKILDRPMAQVKLSDVNDLALELNAEHERAVEAEKKRDAAFLRAYQLEQALRTCLDVCGHAVSAGSAAEAHLILAQRVRKVVAEIIVLGTKNEQARST
jgi:hypothetical protein